MQLFNMNLFILFPAAEIYYRMKKFFVAALIAALGTAALAGCAAKPSYGEYISERRSEIYVYKDDSADISVHCVSREQPYNADGICGDMCDLVEIFVKLTKTPESVEISLDGYSGEMNYEAVDGRFTASYSAPAFSADKLDLTLDFGGESHTYCVLSVLDGNTMTCEQAVQYAAEYDRERFESLTKKRDFEGEIYVRLIYDEGCYYYVGVCDRDKNITAYLLDGGMGKVIATKKIRG